MNNIKNIFNLHRENTIKNSFLGYFSLVVFFVLIVFSINYFDQKRAFLNSEKEKIAILAQQKAMTTRGIIKHHIDLLNDLLASPGINSFVFAQKEDKNFDFKKNDALSRIISTLNANPDVESIFLLDRNGKVILASDDSLIGQDKSKDEYFLETKENVHIKGIYFSETINKNNYTVSARFKDKKNTFSPIILVVRFSPDEIYNTLTDRNGLGSTGEIFLINKDRYFISPPLFSNAAALFKTKVLTKNANECFLDSEIEKTIANGYRHIDSSHIKEYVDYRGVSVLGTHAYIPESGWCLIAKIDNAEVVAPFNRIIIVNILGSILLVLILLLISYFINNKIIKPVVLLAAVSKKIGEGKYDSEILINSKNELGALAMEFRKMTQKLKDSRHEIEKKVDEQTKEIFQKSKDLEDKEEAMLNILEDIQKERTKFEALSKDLEKFKLAVDNASDHIIITDSEGIVLYGNKMVEKITGYSLEETLGKKAGVLWHSPMPKEYYEKFWDIIKNKKQVYVGEIKNKRKNGDLYDASISVSPVLDNNEKVMFFVGIGRDITDEKNVDRAKTEFVSLASHQLRTPLSTINWYAEILLDGDAGPINDEQKKYLKEIETGNQRMVELVNSLLNVSRLELGTFMVEPQETDVVDLMKSIVAELDPLFKKKKHTVEMIFANDMPKVNLDQKLFRMICQNLLSNSIKYTPDKGNIRFELLKKNKDDEISGKKLDQDSFVVIVKDNGYGITKFQQDKIFLKLFRADNVRSKDTEGTGLGLYIVKNIVDNSGGMIWFDSEEDKGTTFYVVMPLSGMKKKEGTKRID